MIAVLLFALAAAPVTILDPSITPGVVRPLTTAQICSIRWGADRRHVTEAMKRQVAAAYDVPWAQHSAYEFDHAISRELGGADDVRNLWPQRWAEARQKDRLENRLHALVCDGTLTLHQAQHAIRVDWRAAYARYVRKAGN